MVLFCYTAASTLLVIFIPASQVPPSLVFRFTIQKSEDHHYFNLMYAKPIATDTECVVLGVLMAAIFRGELSLAKRLINADCDQQHLNHAGKSATDFAELFGRRELLQGLLNK